MVTVRVGHREKKLADYFNKNMSEEINKAVHGAMGLCWHDSKDDGGFSPSVNRYCSKCGTHTRYKDNWIVEPLPDYTTDLNAAFRFAEKLVADGYSIVISRFEHWTIILDKVNGGHGKAREHELGKAICLAGLKALGITPPDSSR
jgi:hypothetical protein